MCGQKVYILGRILNFFFATPISIEESTSLHNQARAAFHDTNQGYFFRR